MEPIRIPIDDVLDLHTFRPQDIANLLADYFDECLKAGIFSVRVIASFTAKARASKKDRCTGFCKKPPGQKLQRCAPGSRRLGGDSSRVKAAEGQNRLKKLKVFNAPVFWL